MLTLSFLFLTVLVAGAITLISRWQAPGVDARLLSRRGETLNTLAAIVERRAEHPVTTLASPTLPPSNGVVVLGSADGVTPGLTPTPAPPPPLRPAVNTTVPLTVATERGPWQPATAANLARVVQVASVDLPPDPLTPDDDPTPWEPLPAASSPASTAGGAEHAAAVRRLPQPQGIRHGFPTADRRDRRRRVLAAAAIIMALASVAVALELRRPGTNAPVITEELLTGGEVAAATPDTTVPSATDATPSPTTPLAPTAVNGDEVGFAVLPPFTLDLVADQPSWVRVASIDGTVLAEQTLQPGGSTQVAVTGPVTVRTGNPAGLVVSADGRLLDHPRLPGQPITLAVG